MRVSYNVIKQSRSAADAAAAAAAAGSDAAGSDPGDVQVYFILIHNIYI